MISPRTLSYSTTVLLYGPQKIVLRMRMSHTPKVDGVSLEASKANSSKEEF